jgi:hypothetical protein
MLTHRSTRLRTWIARNQRVPRCALWRASLAFAVVSGYTLGLQAELEKLKAQTVAQLRELCAQHGVGKTGVKSELVARLLDALIT